MHGVTMKIKNKNGNFVFSEGIPENHRHKKIKYFKFFDGAYKQ